jgi:hypothetical protein
MPASQSRNSTAAIVERAVTDALSARRTSQPFQEMHW